MSSAPQEQSLTVSDTFSYEHIRRLISENESFDAEAFFKSINLEHKRRALHVHDMTGRPMSLLACLVQFFYEQQQPIDGVKLASLGDKAKFCWQLVLALFERQNIPGVHGDTLWFALQRDTECFEDPSGMFKGLLASAENLANIKIRRGVGVELPILFAAIDARLSSLDHQAGDDVFQRLLDTEEKVVELGKPSPLSVNETLLTEDGDEITPLLYVLRRATPHNAVVIQGIVQTLLERGAQMSLNAKTTAVHQSHSLVSALVMEQNTVGLGYICQLYEVKRGFTDKQHSAFGSILQSEQENLVSYCNEHMDGEHSPEWLDMAARLLVHGAPFPVDKVPLASRRLDLVKSVVSYISSIGDDAVQSQVSMRMLRNMQILHEWKDILCVEGSVQTGISNLFNMDKTRHYERSNQDAFLEIVQLLPHVKPEYLECDSDKECWLFWSFVSRYIADYKSSTFTNATMWGLLARGHVQTWQNVVDYTNLPGNERSRSARIVERLKLDRIDLLDTAPKKSVLLKEDEEKPSAHDVSESLPQDDSLDVVPASSSSIAVCGESSSSESSLSPRSELPQPDELDSAEDDTDLGSEVSVQSAQNIDKGKDPLEADEPIVFRNALSLFAVNMDAAVSSDGGAPHPSPKSDVSDSSEPPAVYEDESQLAYSSPSKF